MTIPTLTLRSLLLLLVLAMPMALSAQRNGARPATQPSLPEKYEADFARLTVEFWTPKLDAYKIEIDRMLSAADLVDVNELRTRAALLMERVQTMAKKERERRNARMDGVHDGRQVAGYDVDAIDVAVSADAGTMPEPAYSERSRWEDAPEIPRGSEEDQERMWEKQQAEELRKNFERLEQTLRDTVHAVDVDGNRSASIDMGLYAEQMEGYEMMIETERLRHITRWIARNYRPSMDELMTKVYADLEEFLEASRLQARAFTAAAGSGALDDVQLVESILANLRGLRMAADMKEKNDESTREERSRLEAILMVYNGQGLREFLMIDGGPVAASAAEKLPPGNMLGQNSPNPASTMTTIPYTLAEPGNNVVLKLLDTRGTLVATFPQGSRAAGEHAASIDVSKLAPGTYLCQLTVTTAGGERVSSRGLQVVR